MNRILLLLEMWRKRTTCISTDLSPRVSGPPICLRMPRRFQLRLRETLVLVLESPIWMSGLVSDPGCSLSGPQAVAIQDGMPRRSNSSLLAHLFRSSGRTNQDPETYYHLVRTQQSVKAHICTLHRSCTLQPVCSDSTYRAPPTTPTRRLL